MAKNAHRQHGLVGFIVILPELLGFFDGLSVCSKDGTGVRGGMRCDSEKVFLRTIEHLYIRLLHCKGSPQLRLQENLFIKDNTEPFRISSAKDQRINSGCIANR